MDTFFYYELFSGVSSDLCCVQRQEVAAGFMIGGPASAVAIRKKVIVLTVPQSWHVHRLKDDLH